MNNDLISRSALKKAITEATYNFEQIPIRVDEVQEIIDNAPTVIPEEMKTLIDKTIEILPQLTDAIVENLPTIIDDMDICQECEYRQAARPHGKWIDGYCNICEHSCPCDGWGREIETNFCPSCGADMREADNEQ